MANIQTTITITHGKEVIQTVKDKLLKPASKPKEEAHSLRNFFNALSGSDRDAKLAVQVNSGDAVAASGTITFSSIANNDTVTVGTVTFTAKTSGASGATQFNIGGSDTNAGTNFAAAVNAHSTLSPYVSASAASGVTTITSLISGDVGNNIPIAISAHGSVSAATLASGANATTYSTQNTYKLGKS